MKKDLYRNSMIVLATGLLLTSFFARTSLANEAQNGTIIGGLGGGLLGAIFGKGKVIPTLVGATLGAVVGHEIGREVDTEDQRRANEAYSRTLNGSINEEFEWHSHRNSDDRGRFVPVEEYQNSYGFVCRTYFQEYWINGQYFRKEGRVCQETTGRWIEVSQREHERDRIRIREVEYDRRVSPRERVYRYEERDYGDHRRQYEYERGRTWGREGR